MNHRDIVLTLIFLIISLTMIMVINYTSNSATEALVYYKNELILTIDLTDEKTEYIVEGTNGDVVIEVNDGMIRVVEETSPFNICSNQGYIEYVHEILVCLPNDIVIRLEGTSDIDTIIR